jgi:heparin binding hemagglutinin HbhA
MTDENGTQKNENNQKNEDARNAFTAAIEQLRTPLLAVLGAGNLAGQAVADAIGKAKERVNEGGESARKGFADIPNAEALRNKLDSAELRKAIDEYVAGALKFYNKLANSGEQTWEKIAAQPQVKKALDQLEEALQVAQDRVGDVAGEARERVDDVLSKVTKRTREAGEKAAQKTESTAENVAVKVEETGVKVAEDTRSAARKVANKANGKAATKVGETPADDK